MIIQQNLAQSIQSTRPSIANSQPRAQVSSGTTATIADSVTISQAAREALASAQGKDVPAGDHPLEYYALPSWVADLMPVELSGKLGANANELYLKGGHLIGKFDAELREYGQHLDGHLRTLMQKEGIGTVPEYHQAMVGDQENSERLRQLIKGSIAGDPRMNELMGVLGIKAPG